MEAATTGAVVRLAARRKAPARLRHELAERSEALDQVEAALDRALKGSGACVLIEGPAGVGKSAVLDASRELARWRAMRDLSARGDDLERGFSFGAVLQLFGSPLAAGDAEREALLAGAAGHARALFGGDGLTAAPEDLFPLLHGLHWLSANLADRASLLLALDDLHWFDEPSVRFALYLLQRLDELPIAVVATARSGEGGANERLIRRLAGHAATAAVELDPLSRRGVAQVVRRDRPGASDTLCDACAAATGGNPFHLGELLRRIESDDMPPADVARIGAESVGRAIAARLAALPDPALALAAVVATLGDGVPLPIAAELASLPVDVAIEAVDALVHAAVLAPDAAPRFTHPLVRATVLDGLSAGRRGWLHARAARVLDAHDADAERIAAHLLHDVATLDPWGAAVLERAARLARARGAFDAAVTYLAAAVTVPRPPAERARVLADLALVEARSGSDSAAARAREALTMIEEPAERAAAALRLGDGLLEGGHAHEAAELMRSVLDSGPCDATEIPQLRAAVTAVSALETLAGRPADLEPIVARALAGEASPAERLVLAHGALSRSLAGKELAKVRRFGRAVLAAAPPETPSTQAVTALSLVAIALMAADDLEPALGALTAGVEAARRRGSVVAFSALSHPRAHLLLWMGRLDEAVADAQSALDGGRYTFEPATPSGHAVLALAALERGALDEAREALELPGGEERWRSAFVFNDFLEARGRWRLGQGEPDLARTDFEEVGRRLTPLGTTHPYVVPWRSGLARAALALGDLPAAQRAAREDLDEARAFGAAGPLGLALRTAGLVAGGDRGIALLREAVDVLESSPSVLQRAHASADLGTALLAARHRVAAREPLRGALDLAHRCRATALESAVFERLRAAGARPRRAEASGRDALTPRELGITRLAAEGLTNREIGEALFITLKTVETHLAHAYAKLGISSRGQLADALNDRRSAL